MTHPFLKKLLLKIQAKGLRYLFVGITANFVAFFLGLYIYNAFHKQIGVALISVMGGICQISITFSAQYFLTFKEKQGYFRGLSKAFATSVSAMVLLTALNTFLMWLDFAPYWMIQCGIAMGGFLYSFLVNFLWVFNADSNTNEVQPKNTVQ